MPAPFYVAGPIPSAYARDLGTGYEEERRTIIQYLNRRSPMRLGIFGSEGSGKTSLILSAANQLPTQRAHVQCSRIWPARHQTFYRLLMNAMGLPPPPEPIPQAPIEAYQQLPVPRKGVVGIVVLEDAQHLDAVDPALLNELSVYAVRCPYHIVLTGSAERLRPLVEATVELRPFTDATAAEFLTRRFASDGMTIDEDGLRVFNEFCKGLPESLQRLGHEVWLVQKTRGKTKITAADVDEAVTNLIDHLPSRSLEDWSSLRGITRDIFVAMCLYDLESPTAIGNKIGAEPKNVIVLLNRLSGKHGMVEHLERGTYRVRDLLLKHYVRKEWSSPLLR